MSRLLLMCSLATCVALVGCSKSSCSLGEQSFTYSSGQTRTVFADGTVRVQLASEAPNPEDAEKVALYRVYESHPWSGVLQGYRSDTTVTFIHGLNVIPELVQTYVSYSEVGIINYNVTENAGDQGLIECVDDRVIVLKNNTCIEEMWIRVVATATTVGSDPPILRSDGKETIIRCKEGESLSPPHEPGVGGSGGATGADEASGVGRTGGDAPQ